MKQILWLWFLSGMFFGALWSITLLGARVLGFTSTIDVDGIIVSNVYFILSVCSYIALRQRGDL